MKVFTKEINFLSKKSIAIVLIGLLAVAIVSSVVFALNKKSLDGRSNAATTVLSVSYPALADLYVDSDNPARNYGTDVNLYTDGSPMRIVYLKFDLTQLAGKTINTALLKANIIDDNSSTQTVSYVEDSTWNEYTTTYQNKPAVSSTILATFPGGKLGALTAIDLSKKLTPYLGKQVTFAISTTTSSRFGIGSKETSIKPQLEITYTTSDTSTPIPSATPMVTKTPTPTVMPSATPSPTPTIVATTPTPVVTVTTAPSANAGPACPAVNKSVATLAELKTAIETSKPGDHIRLTASVTNTSTSSYFNPKFVGTTTDAYRCLSFAANVRFTGLWSVGSANNWIFDTIRVTWLNGSPSGSHMFRLSGGTGWILRNSEIWGANSYANIHVTGAAKNWKIVNNYIHDVMTVIPSGVSNTSVQNHDIYVAQADDGLIAGNRITGALNGRCIKIANSSSTAVDHPDRVRVEYNTFRNCKGPTLVGVSYGATYNSFTKNIFENGPYIMNVNDVTGVGNSMKDNVYWNITNSSLVKTDSGTTATFIYDAASMKKLDPMFGANDVPQNAAVLGYGHTAFK
jgi:hypothetical protein